MKKAYAVADFLSEGNKLLMKKTAEECGFEICFFENNKEAAGKVSDAEVIYCCDGELLGSMPRLRWAHSAFAGVGDFVSSGAFDDGSRLLTNSSGAYGRAISEHIIMVTLMLMRRMPEYLEVIAKRGWDTHFAIRSIEESTIVIIGTGDIGRNAAKRYKALGDKKVVGFSRSGRACEPFGEVYRIDEFEKVMADGLSEEMDVLLLCIPGTPESEGLLSVDRIALLSRKTLVINVGRGAVIDQDALIDALNKGRIAGAALDVVYPEPLPADHPLWNTRNCIITPHISGDMALEYTVDITVDIFCDNLRRYADGRELTHLVNVSAGY